MSPSPVFVGFKDNLGFLEIAILVSVFLFGLLSMQTYLYLRTFPHDASSSRWPIGVIWSSTLGYILCTTFSLYAMTIESYGQSVGYSRLPNSMCVSMLFGFSFVGPMVQAMYIHRIYRLSRATLPFAVIGWTVVGGISILGIYLTVQGLASISFLQWFQDYRIMMISTYSISVGLDICITAFICTLLFRAKKDAFRGLGTLMDRIIRWTIQTSFVTSALGIGAICCMVFVENTYLWLALYIPLPPLIVNCLLALLNGRSVLRRMETGLQLCVEPSEVSWKAVDSSQMMSPDLTPLRANYPKTPCPVSENLSQAREISRRRASSVRFAAINFSRHDGLRGDHSHMKMTSHHDLSVAGRIRRRSSLYRYVA